MDWQKTQERLAADVDNWGTIAKAIGLSRMTLARIGSGETPAPRVDTAQKIHDYYAQLDGEIAEPSAAAPEAAHADRQQA